MNELDLCSTTNGITASIVPPSDYYPNKAPAELSSSVQKETRKIQIVCVFLLFGNSFKFYLFSAMSLSLSFKILYPCIELAEFKCGMTSTIFMAYFRQGKKRTNQQN